MNENPGIARDNNSQIGFAEYIGSCQTHFDVQRACAMIGERHGYRYFSIVRMPEQGQTRLADVALATNWPIALIRQYDEHCLLENSPIFAALRRSTAAVEWEIDAAKLVYNSRKDELAAQLFKKHEMYGGIYFNVHSANGQQGAVSFSGKRHAPNVAELMNLNYHSSLIFDKTCSLAQRERKDLPALSKREKECIVWTSHGKTSYEIGLILGLSEHTINNYLANVCRKLGAVNRAHLVGMALRMKILR